MDKFKKLGRSIEDISYLFFSQSEQIKKAVTNEAYSYALPSTNSLICGVFNCCSHPELKSFFSCNLSLEIAKRNHTVSVIDYGLDPPNVRYLMGNLVDLKDNFSEKNNSHLDFRIEAIKLFGFSRLNLVSVGLTKEQMLAKKIAEKIFSDKGLKESDIILINAPHGPCDLILSEFFPHLHKALFIMDLQIKSLVMAYSWVKKFSSLCQQYLIATIIQKEEDISASNESIKKLEKTILKYLNTRFDVLTSFDILLDQEALDSIKLRRPLALIESASTTGKNVADLCEVLLGKK